MKKRYLALILGSMVMYGCGGANGSGGGSGSGSDSGGGDPFDPVPTSVQVRMGEVDLLEGKLNVYMTNDAPVGSFTFFIEGVSVTGVSTEEFGHEAEIKRDGNKITGFPGEGHTIPAGTDQLLTTVSFTPDYQSVGISFSEDSFVTDTSGEEVDSAIVVWVDGTSVWISMEPDYEIGVLEVYMENLVSVGGYQFVLEGDIIITDLQSGPSIPSSWATSSGTLSFSSDMVLAFTMDGEYIPPGERRLLVTVSFSTEAEDDPPIYFDLETNNCIVSDVLGEEPATYWGAE